MNGFYVGLILAIVDIERFFGYKKYMKTVKEYVEDLNRVCREKDLRLTPQRLEVYKTIVRTTEHPSADDILKKVRKRIPNISHDTVYRTLSWLVENQLVFQVGVVNGMARFDGNLDIHAHYICDQCGFIGDIFSDRLKNMNLNSLVPPDFSVQNVLLEFRGICKSCRQ
jgi:Fur family peroxide stress response transcriptional regulator